MNLEKVRKEIDTIDFEIIKLLNRRMELALTSKKFKKKVFDPEREKQVLANVINYAHGVISPEFTKKLFSTVLEESKSLQSKDYKLIAFQGEHGAYGEIAAGNFNGKGIAIPINTFADVFNGVEKGYYDFGVVPVENSLGGSILDVNDLLVKHNVFVIKEIPVKIQHSLLVLPDTNYRDIRVVYSHPQALSQCKDFLERHNFEARPYYDTAGAAKMLFEEKPDATAVIANKLCAKLYHLEVLMENIEDHSENITRFFALSNKPQTKGDKTSIIFSVKHKAGSLFNILKIFAENKINLTRIESMPVSGTPNTYMFFIDFEGSSDDNHIKKTLNLVKENTDFYKWLGSYNKGEIVCE
ncbi:chorismate mutase / prephenate dehydratase [Thermotomaculum hydrothermale]|uniref:Bifunctional chorismate mutase/prephenate dehydratase n=1 Tax=Thermotomaculum hydrothermale TaxID=981385 RepID=A0A7R6PN53_9BACT|nr:prephenate dehydratase [Thermotomaculum hydrothermale]BBB33142.1 chorismate mutase / prephenate dehydratase [Thermotomaculum hydrothermale]